LPHTHARVARVYLLYTRATGLIHICHTYLTSIRTCDVTLSYLPYTRATRHMYVCIWGGCMFGKSVFATHTRACRACIFALHTRDRTHSYLSHISNKYSHVWRDSFIFALHPRDTTHSYLRACMANTHARKSHARMSGKHTRAKECICHTHARVARVRVPGLGQITWWIVLTKKLRGHLGNFFARKSRNSCICSTHARHDSFIFVTPLMHTSYK